MSDRQATKLNALVQRGELLRRLRRFFYDRDFVEVETPLLASEVIPELHIEPPRVGRAYLQASPELHMKRLVAGGMPSIFQVTRSFRADEVGELHNPEFTIVEWYRVGDDLQAGMQLLEELCQTLLGSAPARRTSYAEAFQQHVGLCPHTASLEQLARRTKDFNLDVPETLDRGNRDEWLNLLLALKVEAELGRDAPEILYDYPATQAALAKVVTRVDSIEVAERFELYYHGIELANGYHEVTDARELRRRLVEVNQARQLDGREQLSMPESLLDAMELGLPACTGCALGFDRLVMLALELGSLREVMAFPGAAQPSDSGAGSGENSTPS